MKIFVTHDIVFILCEFTWKNNFSTVTISSGEKRYFLGEDNRLVGT